MNNTSLDDYEKKVEQLVDAYFNIYNEYNDVTINTYFSDLFYSIETELNMDIANDTEQQIRNIVFNGGIKNATSHKN